MYVAVLDYDLDNRVTKFSEFATEAEADAHVAAFIGSYSNAFTSLDPGGGAASWLVSSGSLSESVDLQPLKLAKKAELDTAYDAAANADVVWNGNTYQADKSARENMEELSVYRGTGGALPVGFTWRTQANVNVAFTWTDFDGLITAVATQKFTAVSNLHTKKDALEAAATVAEVNAITW